MVGESALTTTSADAHADSDATTPPILVPLAFTMIGLRLALDVADAEALCESGAVEVSGEVVTSKSAVIRPDQVLAVRLLPNVRTLRQCVPRATTPAIEASAWPDPLQRQVLWGFAGVSCFICNTSIEALCLRVARPTVADLELRLFARNGGLVMDAVPEPMRELIDGASLVMRTRTIEEAIRRFLDSASSRASPYKRFEKNANELLVGPANNEWFFWPLLGAYKDEARAKKFAQLSERYALLDLNAMIRASPRFDASGEAQRGGFLRDEDAKARVQRNARCLAGSVWSLAFDALLNAAR